MTSESMGVNPTSAASAADRLEVYIASARVITFEAGFPDKEYPYIICSMWGSIPTNELFVRLSSGTVSFVECIPSPLELPPMIDRGPHMDEADAQAASDLADRMWEKYRNYLVRE